MKTTKQILKNISNGWEKAELSSFLSISNKKYDPNTRTDDLPCIELEHLRQGTPQLLGMIQARNQKSVKNYFQCGDILFGKLRPYLRKYLLARFTGVCSSEIWVLKNTSETTNKFIFYFIQTEKFISYANVSSGSKMPRSDWSYLKNVNFFRPPLPEQTRIVAVLEVWDKAIERLAKKIQVKRNIKKGLMQQLLTGQKRLCGFEDEWQTLKLGSAGEIISGGTPSKNKEEYWRGKIPWISSSDLIEGKIRFANIRHFISLDAINNSATKIVPKNSIILVSRVGVGKVFINENAICTSQDFQSLVVSDQDKYDYVFLAYLLLRKAKIFLNRNQGTSIKGFLKKDLENMSLLMPVPLKEQTAIATILTAADNEITKLEKKLTLLKDQRKYLLNNLITGAIRMPENLLTKEIAKC